MTSYLGNDTTAAIAWAGTGKCDYRVPDSLNLDCYFYCIITEVGNLWKLSLCNYEHFQFQLAHADRVSMLLAMMGEPMTAQELAHRLNLHPSSVFRDLNSMSNSNLLLREVLGGKNTYRTNFPLMQKLFQKILQMFDDVCVTTGH